MKVVVRINILYFALDSNSASSGISNKIKNQASALGEKSTNLWLMMASRPSGISIFKYDKKTSQLVLNSHINGESGGSYFLRYRYLDKVVVKVFDDFFKEHDIDAVYCRRIPMLPCLIKMFKKTKKNHNYVLGYEIPTYPYLQEHIKAGQLLHLATELSFSRLMYSLVDHFFLITDSENAKKVPFTHWTRITNGIDVKKTPIRSTYPPLYEGLHLLGVAHLAFWHGYDRIIAGLCEYYKKDPDGYPVFFHIVGDGKIKAVLQQQAKENGLEDKVSFHGSLHGKKLDCLFDRCHLGIGSLGGHRKKFSETSELKARDYCARGIPFIMSMKDPDFDCLFPYIYYVSSDENPIDIQSLIKFGESILTDDRKTANEMREYARTHLDWQEKMDPAYSILENIVKQK